MPSWPASLPQFVQEQGYSETLPQQRIESVVDAGPPKTRRRFTNNNRPITCEIWCDASQAAAFETFYDADLAGGVLSFTWVNPITQAAKTFRFRGNPPQKSVRGGAIVFSFSLWQLN